MRRAATFALATLAVLVGGCDNSKAKVEAAADQAGQAVDKLERDVVDGHLAAAKAALAADSEPAEPCTWASANPAASQPAAVELRRLCSFDAPLRRATRAVVAAEKARAELPDAPSLTECQSETWSAAKRLLDRDHGAEPTWTALATRWAKTCP